MSNEWKKLDISNLPSDIIVGNYEFRSKEHGEWEVKSYSGLSAIQYLHHNIDLEYRKKETPPPTHEEIMTKWWQTCNSKTVWLKVFTYEPSDKNCYGILSKIVGNQGKGKTDSYRSWVSKEWFIGKRSATIPPEAE